MEFPIPKTRQIGRFFPITNGLGLIWKIKTRYGSAWGYIGQINETRKTRPLEPPTVITRLSSLCLFNCFRRPFVYFRRAQHERSRCGLGDDWMVDAVWKEMRLFLHGKAVVCACCFLVVHSYLSGRFVASGGMAMVWPVDWLSKVGCFWFYEPCLWWNIVPWPCRAQSLALVPKIAAWGGELADILFLYSPVRWMFEVSSIWKVWFCRKSGQLFKNSHGVGVKINFDGFLSLTAGAWVIWRAGWPSNIDKLDECSYVWL